MAQPTNYILSPEQLDATDYRKQFVEVGTHATDFVTGDTTLILSTVPFYPVGDSFSKMPLYAVGIAQQFSYNEGLPAQPVPEVGSSRRIIASGTASGNGMISRLAFHGNSLVAALYRPVLAFIQSTDSLNDIADRIVGTDKQWIQALNAQNLDLYSADMDAYVDRVIAAGGMNALLYKVPFGLVIVKRDPRQRATSINFLEQCILAGNQDGLSSGQFQVVDSFSFQFERMRPLKAIGPFSLSDDTTVGM